MIDLEETLSALVERAPEPPAVEGIVRRARQRQRRRRGVALATTLIVLAAGLAGATAIVSSRGAPRVAGVVPNGVEHVHLTLLDGSQLEISGPHALGLTTFAPAFNASLGPVAESQPGIGHGFSVTRTPPHDVGAVVVGRYPTHDGHQLVVHQTAAGVEAVVSYGGWWLSTSWGHEPTDWARFASELNAKETPDGYLVVEPTDASWKVGPTDAPDAQIGGEAYGSGAQFGFFGPKTYPAGCPDASNTSTRTGQGWPVSRENGAWWCDANAKVRVAAWDPKSAGTAIAGLRVSFTDAGAAVASVTTLQGSKFAITAPASVLDHFITQATVAVDGLATRTPIVISAERTDAAQHEGDAPQPLPDSPFTTGDGHRLVVTRYALGDVALEGTYGGWTVHITVTGASNADRTRIASLFAAHEAADGYLVLDPRATDALHRQCRLRHRARPRRHHRSTRPGVLDREPEPARALRPRSARRHRGASRRARSTDDRRPRARTPHRLTPPTPALMMKSGVNRCGIASDEKTWRWGGARCGPGGRPGPLRTRNTNRS